jgi:hypothetical protein
VHNYLKKYLFSFLVATYLVTIVGIPVYFHYCGGDLENIYYVIKGNSCCGEEESEMNSDCCHDENIVIQSNPDITLKSYNGIILYKSDVQYADVNLIFNKPDFQSYSIVSSYYLPPPRLHQQLIINTTVLRI